MSSEELFQGNRSLSELNKSLKRMTGMDQFFRSPEDIQFFTHSIGVKEPTSFARSPKDFGDFQTPTSLTDRICLALKNNGCNPKAVIEPTAGRGNFLVSALKTFPSLKTIFAMDRQPKYEWEFKKNLFVYSKSCEVQAEIKYIVGD